MTVGIFVCMFAMLGISTDAIAQKQKLRPIDFSGVYTGLPIKRCTEDMAASQAPSGRAIYWNCYTGDAFGPTPTLRLIQNGQYLCGYFDAAEGAVGKLYAGRVVGQLKTAHSTTVELSWADGHQEIGPAQTLRLRFPSQTSIQIEDGRTSTLLMRRDSYLVDPENAKSCTPQISQPVMLRNGDLDVLGLPDITSLWFTPMKSSSVGRRPDTKVIVLTDKTPIGLLYEDKRKGSNFMIRPVKIINKATHSMTVVFGLGEICWFDIENLAPWTRGIDVHSPLTLRPNDMVVVATCKDSNLLIAKSEETDHGAVYPPPYSSKWVDHIK